MSDKTINKRTVIIHKHIFKNAGTTFDWILKNNFGTDFCDHRDDKAMRRGGEKYLIKYLKEHPNIKALSSHHVWFRPSDGHDLEIIPVFFLRHPIERIRSVYNFEKQQQADSLGAKMAKQMNFAEYVAWRMSDDVPATIRNFQTKMIAGLKPGHSATKDDLNAAMHLIGEGDFAGVVDLFDLSMKTFGKSFSKEGINLNLHYEPQNVMQPVEAIDVYERANIILDELGPLATEVLEKNAFDMELYDFAKKQLIKKQVV